MKTKNKNRLGKYRWFGVILTILILGVSGCANSVKEETESIETESIETESMETESIETEKSVTEISETESPEVDEIQDPEEKEPEIIEIDCSDVFAEYNGSMVLYDPSQSQYMVYQPSIAKTRYAPCSTFKIIASVLGIEQGVIDLNDSTRKWSGETFWNDKWNRDINFEEAFRNSCVWYFRAVNDDLGPETVKEGLDSLSYGNCDISDWEGKLNTIGTKPALMGFWLESSLDISPIEQTQVMERIFGADSPYKTETIQALKQVMKLDQDSTKPYTIYGKTGLGRRENDISDTWYVGFAETEKGRIYFAAFVGDKAGMKIPSGKAKELAIQVIENFSNGKI